MGVSIPEILPDSHRPQSTLMADHFSTNTFGLARPLELDAKAPLVTSGISHVRAFYIRDWAVAQIRKHGRIARIVVSCETVSRDTGEFRECHVSYSLDFIERNELQVEENLILHARAQILSELNHVFGCRDWSAGESVIEVWCE